MRILAALAATVMLAGVAGCGGQASGGSQDKQAGTEGQDKRAYPGSVSQSIEKLLGYYHLKLPDCAQASLRYGQYVQSTTDSFYLTFAGNDDCISEFLSTNNLEHESRVEADGLPFIPSFGKQYGWPQGTEGRYAVISATLDEPGKSSLVKVLLAIDPSDSPRKLYLRAVIL